MRMTTDFAGSKRSESGIRPKIKSMLGTITTKLATATVMSTLEVRAYIFAIASVFPSFHRLANWGESA